MPRLLSQLETLDAPVTSPSGVWALRYDAEGRAVIRDDNGATAWAAGAVGALRLEDNGAFAVYDGDQVVWRGDLPKLDYSSLSVTDDGDGIIHDHGLPVHSLLNGPIEPVSLGDKAPVAEIVGNRFLESGDGKRTVNRTPDGDALVHKWKLGMGAYTAIVVQPAHTAALDAPGTWLTWRFLKHDGLGNWELVLVDDEDEVRWVFGRGYVAEFEAEPLAAEPTTANPEA
ncbi:hypothetical protein [Saccharopolyspora shandongensis]|uniref:hypothetical protein n=1 Tax=Saccharopolyspora shandongensis TaxID=418495 RepID=UPI0033E00607